MARFALFTDANVDGRLVRALLHNGWEVKRCVDVFVQDEDDDMIFEYAAKENLVFVTNDETSWPQEKAGSRKTARSA